MADVVHLASMDFAAMPKINSEVMTIRASLSHARHQAFYQHAFMSMKRNGCERS